MACSLRSIKLCFTYLIVAIVLVGARSAAAGAEDLALKQAVAMMGWILLLHSGAPGLVLGAVRGKELAVLGFGETQPGSRVAPDGRAIVRVGSIAKVMAGQVLASMAADGSVKLTDPLAKYAPPGGNVPAFAGRQITLLDLATFTAGLPRELPEAPDPTLGQQPSPGLEPDAYWRWLSGASLPYAPGSGAIYSNLGFALLGEALAKAAGEPYATLLRKRVTGPLAMVDTGTALDEAQAARAMTGFDHDGKPVPPRKMPAALDASGNVFTTGDDMMKWIGWHLATDDPAGADVRMLDHAAYRWRGELAVAVNVGGYIMDGLGLGWTISLPKENRPLMLTKSGGLPGFVSYVVLAPSRGVGVFIAVNRFRFPMFDGLNAGVHELIGELAPR